nr:phosphoribosylformylglycinamidine synthase subunit PurS [Terracoccus sp. 273MFTsu3.1]
MGSIVVDVMLKPEILDPQGQAVGGALPRLGFNGFTDVRQGKRFVLTVDGDVTDEHLAAAREAAETLLSNPVIEDVVSVHVLDESAADETPADEADAPAEDADGEPDDAEDGEQ